MTEILKYRYIQKSPATFVDPFLMLINKLREKCDLLPVQPIDLITYLAFQTNSSNNLQESDMVLKTGE